MVAANVDVGRQVGDDVVVTGGDQESDARPIALAAHIERHDAGQRAVERCGELVDGDPVRLSCQSQCQPESPALAVAQFPRSPEHQPRFGQSARRQQCGGSLEPDAQCVDHRVVGQFQCIDVEYRRAEHRRVALRQVRGHRTEQARFSGPAGAGEDD